MINSYPNFYHSNSFLIKNLDDNKNSRFTSLSHLLIYINTNVIQIHHTQKDAKTYELLLQIKPKALPIPHPPPESKRYELIYPNFLKNGGGCYHDSNSRC